jgi:anti-anti-sigma factor
MVKDVVPRQNDSIGFMDFPRDVTAQTRESAYTAYNTLARARVKHLGLNFEGSDYLNSAGIGLIISLVEDAMQAGRTVFAYGLSSHYRKLFSMVGLTERIKLVANEGEMLEKCGVSVPPPAGEVPPAPPTSPTPSTPPVPPTPSVPPTTPPGAGS